MIQIVNISLIPSENKPVINVSQFDNISRVLRFNVFDDAEMETPHVFDNTETVLLNIRKNDNNIVVITGVIVSDIDPETQEVTEQYLTFELTEQACACVGSNYGEVSITDGSDEVIGSCNFKLIVERSPLAGGVSSQTAIDNLTTQIEQITEEVIGDNYYNKEEVNGLINAVGEAIPTKTSQLQNDSGYITEDDIPTIPTKTSQLQNDSGYITEDDIPTIPTKTSQLTNDSGFTTIDDAVTANDKTWSSDKISDALYALLPVGTVSGSIASFNTALDKPLVSCVVDENATMLYQRGINLWNEVWEVGAISNNTGVNYSSDNYWRTKDFIPIKPNTELYISSPTGRDGASIATRFYDKNKNYIGYTSPSGYRAINRKFTTPDNAYFLRFNPIVEDCPNHDISVNYPSSDTTYHAYNNNSTEYNLPLSDMPNVFSGDNNFFTDNGDISVSYKDTIQNYIDTRVNTVSNRSLSMQRTLETLEKSISLDKTSELERGDNNDDNAR